MAFPFVIETTFEAGSNVEWTSETDSGSQLDFPHVSELARFPYPEFAPYRGAYVARWRLGANTTDAFLRSTTIDIADNGTSYFRWYMLLGRDFLCTADDVISIFKLRQAAGGTVEMTVGLSCTAATGAILLGGSDGTAAATFGTTPLQLGKWHCIEVAATVATGGTGAITTYLDGIAQSAESSKTQAAAVGDGDLGFSDRLATSTGTVLMDQFVQDDERVYPITDRFPESLLLTKSSTVFLGPGSIDNVSLMSGAGTDNVLRVFDTAWGNVTDATKLVLELKNTANNELVDPAGTPVTVSRGCFVQLTGTNPRALVKLARGAGWGSQANMRNQGLKAVRYLGEGL